MAGVRRPNTNYLVKEVRGHVKVKGLTLPLILIYAFGLVTGLYVNECGRVTRQKEKLEKEKEN